MWPLKSKIGLGQPATEAEKTAAEAALKKKYPNMPKPGWSVAKAIKEARTKETGSSQHRMGMSNLSPDVAEDINKKMRDKQYR